jgi:hypothetical protein
MPIRINFLAEQQAADERKRRDPVKRAQLVAGVIIGLLVLRSAYLEFQLMRVNAESRAVASQFKGIESQYRLVRTNDLIASTSRQRLAALRQLATNRFLWANSLNALQYTLVSDIQVSRFKGAQTFTVTDATPSVTNSSGVVRGKPATSLEKTLITLEARDFAPNPGDDIRLFQDRLTNQPYYRTNLRKAELTGRSPVQTEPGEPREFVVFTLDAQFPERVR